MEESCWRNIMVILLYVPSLVLVISANVSCATTLSTSGDEGFCLSATDFMGSSSSITWSFLVMSSA